MSFSLSRFRREKLSAILSQPPFWDWKIFRYHIVTYNFPLFPFPRSKKRVPIQKLNLTSKKPSRSRSRSFSRSPMGVPLWTLKLLSEEFFSIALPTRVISSGHLKWLTLYIYYSYIKTYSFNILPTLKSSFQKRTNKQNKHYIKS